MKKRFFYLSILLCCIMLSGCSATTNFSAFAWMIDSVQEEREHDCDITVRDTDGEVLYVNDDKDVIDYFADLVEQLDENELQISCQGGVMYEYVMRDNNKKVAFYLYEPGNVLSCGVGRVQVYFKIPEDMQEILMHPENWIV